MLKGFRMLQPAEINENCFKLIGEDWMLITAGNQESWNTMTASWGQMGVLWNKPVAICYIRPQRYTFGFAEGNEYYTLSFFEEEYRKALQFCGSKSGRDYDKAKETGLSPIETEKGNISFKEASLIIECRKIYVDNLEPENFVDKELIVKNYPKNDFHRFYIGEITGVWMKKE